MPVFGIIMMLVFLVFFSRMVSGQSHCGHPGFWNRGFRDGGAESPADIARRRYAKGEISREELEEMLRVLED